ncbi:P-loop ATPase, Sll1717 family [Oceanobacter antarcticus]|uniref:ATP-binding protein n=1 Tax=Oceanobacter antarcticus TaxID=3133425 RepID=A0ABW8ND04_9GAMM
MEFNEYELQRLFGHEAAEDEDPERLRQYYFKNKTYSQVVNDLPLRILVGHKGIGKSALFQVAIDEESSKNRLTLLIKPDDILGIAEDATDFLKLIRDWKAGINEIIARKALTSFGLLYEGWRGKLNQYGGAALDFLSSTLKAENTVNLSASKQAVLKDFLCHNKISVYIDDLDRGWEGRKSDIQRISALLNAIRDISTENRGIYFRISLRSDVYYLARTSDESTDKTESSVIWHTWSNYEILVLLVKRIESYFGRDVDEEELLKKHQWDIFGYLNEIIEERFTGKGHWNNAPMYRVLMSLIRKRPRDLVKLLTLAGREANRLDATIISTNHLEAVFEEYSQGRLQDTFNEYRSEFPQIEKLILGMRPSKIQRKASQGYVYSTDELLKKIRAIEEQGKYKWANGNTADTKELAAFLYKINFITARKKVANGIDRKYFEENRYLSNKFTEFGYDWEVHPAYRWALQPDEPLAIFNELELSSVE